jgi:hypothetical protein
MVQAAARCESATMGYTEALAEFNKLEEVLNLLARFSDRVASARTELARAQRSIEGNKDSPDALANVEREIRKVRAKILSELASIAKLYDIL